jgi:hypothetical protein
MIIYNWLTDETAPILLEFIDNKLSGTSNKQVVKSRYGGINNGEVKLISFTKDDCVYTIVIDKTGIKHSKELVELEEIEAFVLQEIRNQKLENLGIS